MVYLEFKSLNSSKMSQNRYFEVLFDVANFFKTSFMVVSFMIICFKIKFSSLIELLNLFPLRIPYQTPSHTTMALKFLNVLWLYHVDIDEIFPASQHFWCHHAIALRSGDVRRRFATAEVCHVQLTRFLEDHQRERLLTSKLSMRKIERWQKVEKFTTNRHCPVNTNSH